jgi:hypothetical protein
MSTVHHQECLNTVYTAVSICHASSLGCLLAGAKRTNISETCRVLYQINWEIVHFVGFHYKTYHDARPSECHSWLFSLQEYNKIKCKVQSKQIPYIHVTLHESTPTWKHTTFNNNTSTRVSPQIRCSEIATDTGMRAAGRPSVEEKRHCGMRAALTVATDSSR